MGHQGGSSLEDFVARRYFQLEYLLSVWEIWSAKRKTHHYKSRRLGVGYNLRREHRMGVLVQVGLRMETSGQALAVQ